MRAAFLPGIKQNVEVSSILPKRIFVDKRGCIAMAQRFDTVPLTDLKSNSSVN